MTDYVYAVLDELVPRFEGERGDWARVVADADGRRHERVHVRRPSRLTPRRLVLVALAIVALVTPLFAAASKEWWFFRFPDSTPDPVSGVSVIRTGSWDGEPWELSAYVSATDGLCFALTPTSSGRRAGEGAALSCASVVGVPRTAESKPSEPLAITFLAGFSIDFPAHVVGPVIDTADEVAIHLDDGTVLRTPTFDAPDELGSIRFYATRMPEWERTPGVRPPPSGIRMLVGLTSEGEIVACLALPSPQGAVPLSACE